MAWQFKPKTFDGVAINDGTTYISYFEFPDAPMRLLQRRPVELSIPGDFSFVQSPRSQPQSAHLTIHLQFKAAPTDANLTAMRQLFDRYKGFVTLVVEDGTPAEWNLSVKVDELREINAVQWEIDLYTNRPVMDAVTVSSDNETGISVSPTTWALSPAVAGVVRNYPVFAIGGTTQKSDADDYNSRWHVSIAWRSELPGEDSMGFGYPIDIADDNLDTSAEVTATRMLPTGNDLAVMVDGVMFKRALDGINTTTTKVWVPIHFSPRKQVLLEPAPSASNPATTTGTWRVKEGQTLIGWPERGSFLVDNERVWYGSRTDVSFSLLERGYANTTAAAHASDPSTADWVEHEIQILSDWSGASAPTAAVFAMSLSASTNLAHTYSVLFTSSPVQRNGQMRGRFTQDNSKATVLSLGETSNLNFTDTPAGGARYPFNNAELYVPCGVAAAASALAFDATGGDNGVVNSDIVLMSRIYGVDLVTGVERILASYDKATRTTGLTITPDAVLSNVRFNALYTCITGCWRDWGTYATDLTLDNADTDEDVQRFTLDQDCAIYAIALAARENAGADTRTLQLGISVPRTGGGSPEPRDTVIPDGGGGVGSTVPNAQFGTTYRWVYKTIPGVSVPARSDYDLQFNGDAAGAGTLLAAIYAAASTPYGGPFYSRGTKWTEAASVWTEQPQNDHSFLIIGDGTAVQPEAPTGMGGYVAFDNFVVTFDNATPRTPKIVRSAREDDIYILRGTLRNTLTTQEIAILYVGKVGADLGIDCRNKLVYKNQTLRQFYPGAVTLSDPEEWMRLSPTEGQIRWTEADIGTVHVSTTWQNAWA